MSNTKRVMVVDDEPLASERLRSLINEIAGYHVGAIAGDGVTALELAKTYAPELVLLDIAMPGMNGLEVARHLQKLDMPPAVIFCTAYGEYGVEAFDTAAVGYLLKPVRLENLRSALQKAVSLNRLQLTELEQQGLAKREHKTHISTRSHRGVELLEISKISCFVSEDKYVFAYHEGGETILEQTLKTLEEEFSEYFIRVHRNALVAINRIEALERAGSESRLRLRGSSEKPIVSRRHLKEVKELMRRL